MTRGAFYAALESQVLPWAVEWGFAGPLDTMDESVRAGHEIAVAAGRVRLDETIDVATEVHAWYDAAHPIAIRCKAEADLVRRIGGFVCRFPATRWV